MLKNKSSFSLEPVIGAGDGTRTRDIRLGKPTLYQLSYARKECGFIQFLYLHVNNKKLIYSKSSFPLISFGTGSSIILRIVGAISARTPFLRVTFLS